MPAPKRTSSLLLGGTGDGSLRVEIFLSYRRSDVGGYAGRLSDALGKRLGSQRVFQDVSAIAPGQDFTVAIDRALDRCDVVLAVIGPGWLGQASEPGASRIHADDDYVRLELSRALERGVRVVPVLVGRSELPTPDQLPEGLRPLLLRQAVILHDETWHEDVTGLMRSLRPERSTRLVRRRGVIAAAAGATLLVAGGGVWLWAGRGDAPGTVLPSCPAARSPEWTPITLDPSPTVDEDLDQGVLTYTVKHAYWKRDRDGWTVVIDTRMKAGTPESSYHEVWRYDALAVGDHRFPPTCFSSVPDLVDAEAVGDATLGFRVTCEPAGRIEIVLENGARLSVTDRSLSAGAC